MGSSENERPAATIAFVPRETISQTLDMLDTLLAHTEQPYELVVVTAGYPADIVAGIRRRVGSVGGRLIELGAYATPNEARNAALEATATDYIVFVDHDVHVDRGWLGPLVDCARETGAAIVGPLTFELRPLFSKIHMAGGEARVLPKPSGGNAYHELHFEQHARAGAAKEFAERQQTELVEFHTVLVEAAWLRSVGGLDPDLLSLSEHWDMCITAARTGRSVFMEPRSRVNYSPPSRLSADDIRWFTVRWSEEWNSRSIRRLSEKYAIDLDDDSLIELRRFLKNHRKHRYAPLRSRLSRFLGRRLGGIVTDDIIRPAVEFAQKRRLRRDLANWEAQRQSRAGRAIQA